MGIKKIHEIASTKALGTGNEYLIIDDLDDLDVNGDPITKNILASSLTSKTVVYFASDVATANAITGAAEGEYVFVETENTLYAYKSSAASYTVNNTSVLATASAGNTRWLAIAGQYSITDKQSNVVLIDSTYDTNQESEGKYADLENALNASPSGTYFIFQQTGQTFSITSSTTLNECKFMCGFTPSGYDDITIVVYDNIAGYTDILTNGIAWKLGASITSFDLSMTNSYFNMNLNNDSVFIVDDVYLYFDGGYNYVYITNFDAEFMNSTEYIDSLHIFASNSKIYETAISSVGDLAYIIDGTDIFSLGRACNYLQINSDESSQMVDYPNGWYTCFKKAIASVLPAVSRESFLAFDEMKGKCDLIIYNYDYDAVAVDSFTNWTALIGSNFVEYVVSGEIFGEVNLTIYGLWQTSQFTSGMGDFATPCEVLHASIDNGTKINVYTLLNDNQTLFYTSSPTFYFYITNNKEGSKPEINLNGLYKMNIIEPMVTKKFVSFDGYYGVKLNINGSTEVYYGGAVGVKEVILVDNFSGDNCNSEIFVDTITNNDLDFVIYAGDLISANYDIRYIQTESLGGNSALVLNGLNCDYHFHFTNNGDIIVDGSVNRVDNLIEESALAGHRADLYVNSNYNVVTNSFVYGVNINGDENFFIGNYIYNTLTDSGSNNRCSYTVNRGGVPVCYSETFNAAGDWTDSGAGYYYINFVHNLNSNKISVSVWEDDSSDYFIVYPDIYQVAYSTTTVQLRVSSGPDLRFAGRIVVK